MFDLPYSMLDSCFNEVTCLICEISALNISVQCDDYRLYIHLHCEGLSDARYGRLTKSKKPWSNPFCISRILNGRTKYPRLNWLNNNPQAELARQKAVNQARFDKFASGIDSPRHSLMVKGICKNKKLKRLNSNLKYVTSKISQ